jgi:5-hydroxyisourate hydrolase
VSAVTTHVLDTARGQPAAGVPVVLEHVAAPLDQLTDGTWERLAGADTDADGRARELGPDRVPPGRYRLRFDTGRYFEAQGAEAFYPEVVVTFVVADADQHYHVPLLLSRYGYSTYRGS